MKYKVGDKVRIKSKDWFNDDRNKNEATYSTRCTWDERKKYCGWVCTITRASESSELFKVDLDNEYFDWPKYMFDDSFSYNIEKSILLEEMIKDMAEVVKKHNLGVSISENEGKLIIEPLKVEEDDLPIDTPCIVSHYGNINFMLRYYAGNKECYDSGNKSKSFHHLESWNYIIPFDMFNPNNIEESLKYNIVKQ